MFIENINHHSPFIFYNPANFDFVAYNLGCPITNKVALAALHITLFSKLLNYI